MSLDISTKLMKTNMVYQDNNMNYHQTTKIKHNICDRNLNLCEIKLRI